MDQQPRIFTVFDSSDDEDSDSTQLNETVKKVVLATSSVRLQLDSKEMWLIMQFTNMYGWRGICKKMENEMNFVFTTLKQKRPFSN